MKNKSVFLSAEWRKLIMFNYEIDPKLVQPYLPLNTEIDYWEGKTYISIVGFMFYNTRMMGLKIPFHINFEEINLRFYVKRKDGEEWKRGVVFIKEIVPKPAIAITANLIYKEHYISLPMKHDIIVNNSEIQVKYSWKYKKEWNEISLMAKNELLDIMVGSEEEFITEHYWGYGKAKNYTIEYQVEHPRWQIYPVLDYSLNVNVADLYGKQLAEVLKQKPNSVLLAEGSGIIVRKASYIRK